jgi:Bacterial extracellular solute-binding proteins, family 3
MPIADLNDGQSVGLSVEIVRAAAERSRIDVEFVPVPFEEVQKTLDDGRAVAIFPFAITPASVNVCLILALQSMRVAAVCSYERRARRRRIWLRCSARPL